MGLGAGEIQQLDHVEKKPADPFINRWFFLAKLGAQRHVFFDVAPGHQRRLLKHHRHRRLAALLADELDRTGARLFQAGDDVQQRRLAAAGGADDAEELPIAHLKIDAADGPGRPLGGNKFFGNPVNDDFHDCDSRAQFRPDPRLRVLD